MTSSYERIIQAIGLYDHFIDVQGGQFVESEQFAQHAVQSIVWAKFGKPKDLTAPVSDLFHPYC